MRTDQGALLIFGHSPVQGDPIVYGGPFVMNSDDDIKQAFTDYRNGRLGHI
jgi:quercetin 2,3-dioxygenase